MTRYNSPELYIISKKVTAIALLAILYTLLNALYWQEIAPSNPYLNVHEIFLEELLLIALFSLVPLFFLQKEIFRPSEIITWLLFSFSYLPTAFFSIYYFELLSDYIYLMLLLITGLALFRYSSAIRFGLKSKVTVDFYGIDAFVMFIVLASTVIYIWSLAGFNVDFDLTTVYERRLLAREIDTGIMAYFMVMTRTMFLVLGVYLWIAKKNTLYLLISLAGVVGIFSFDGTKTALYLPMIIILYALFIHKFKMLSKNPSSLLFIFFILSFFGLMEWNFIGTPIISEYLVRRIFVIPGVINSFYFEYFTTLNESSLTQLAFGSFGNAGKDIGVSYIIGAEYFGNKATNANSGIWMSSYAYFGIIGLLIASMISGLIAGVLDSLVRPGKEYLGMMIGVMVGITWSEQALHTSILSGGIFFFILLLFLINVSARLNRNYDF